MPNAWFSGVMRDLFTCGKNIQQFGLLNRDFNIRCKQLAMDCTIVEQHLFKLWPQKVLRNSGIVQGAIWVRGSYCGAVIHVIIIKHLHLSLSGLDQRYNGNKQKASCNQAQVRSCNYKWKCHFGALWLQLLKQTKPRASYKKKKRNMIWYFHAHNFILYETNVDRNVMLLNSFHWHLNFY